MKFKVVQAALLLAILPCGCVHKERAQNQLPLAPPIEDTPPPKPDNAPINLPPPVVTVPPTKKPTVTQAPPPPPPPKPTTRHRRKQAEDTQVAENTPPPAPEVSAAGNLTTGEPNDVRQETTNSLTDTEHRLNTLGRKLNDQEEKTGTQIREYIKEARAALDTGDVDGAKGLAQKAKLLLGELTK